GGPGAARGHDALAMGAAARTDARWECQGAHVGAGIVSDDHAESPARAARERNGASRAGCSRPRLSAVAIRRMAIGRGQVSGAFRHPRRLVESAAAREHSSSAHRTPDSAWPSGAAPAARDSRVRTAGSSARRAGAAAGKPAFAPEWRPEYPAAGALSANAR